MKNVEEPFSGCIMIFSTYLTTFPPHPQIQLQTVSPLWHEKLRVRSYIGVPMFYILARVSHFILHSEAGGANPVAGLRLFQNFEFVKEGRKGHYENDNENDCNDTADDTPNSAV
jgi:hypothetical protein